MDRVSETLPMPAGYFDLVIRHLGSNATAAAALLDARPGPQVGQSVAGRSEARPGRAHGWPTANEAIMAHAEPTNTQTLPAGKD